MSNIKQDVILAATVAGFFRVKSEDKKAAALAEVQSILSDYDAEQIESILVAEVAKRHEASQKRLAKKVSKEIADENKPVSGGYHDVEYPILPGRNFIVTVAQNNTDVHADAWASLQTLAQDIDAQIVVCRSYYNKTGFEHPEHGTDDIGIYFDTALQGYFVDSPCILGDSGALLVANANVIPTARNPLSGFENLGDPGQDVIIPAVKIALKCTAALKGSTGKRLFSTGAVTLRNYIKRKAGQISEKEHNIGALVVTPNDIRHVEVMPGECGFYYYNSLTTPDAVTTNMTNHVEALQFGDIHAEKADDVSINDAKNLIECYKPTNVILHDLMDFSSRNHHNIKDCTFIFEQHSQRQSVVGDCNKVIDLLERLAADSECKFHIIESNHDLAMQRWLKEADFKTDPVNAEFYLAAMLAYYQDIRLGKTHNALEHACCHLGFRHAVIKSAYDESLEFLPILPGKFVFHGTDESVMIAGVEMGNHGHNGANGSRGSPEQFRKLGVPMNTGHTHTPNICGAVYTAGVAGSLEMGYNVGPSSWRIAHIVTYVNGQRAIHFS